MQVGSIDEDEILNRGNRREGRFIRGIDSKLDRRAPDLKVARLCHRGPSKSNGPRAVASGCRVTWFRMMKVDHSLVATARGFR